MAKGRVDLTKYLPLKVHPKYPTVLTAPYVKLLGNSDPDNSIMKQLAAIYHGFWDEVFGIKEADQRRINRIISRPKEASLIRGDVYYFLFVTSVVTRGHWDTYATRNVRAAAGQRANEISYVMLPEDADDEDARELAELLDYYADKIKRAGEDGKRLQVARYFAPQSAVQVYIYAFNAQTLAEAIFPQRLWLPGAQWETKECARQMWEQVHSLKPEFWDTVYDRFGPDNEIYIQTMRKLRRENPELYESVMNDYGYKLKSAWDK